MTTARATATTTLLALLLLVGCGTSSSGPGTGGTATPAAAGPAAGPPTTIPAGVRLRHEDTWAVTGRDGHGSPMPWLCVDPPPRLTDARPTDARARYDDRSPAQPSEALGVYAGPPAAAEAVADWREEVAVCGAAGPQSHSGEPVEWFVREARVEGADEAWHAYELSTDVAGRDLLGHDPFVTVARLGNAVYVETFRHPGHLDDASIAEGAVAGAASVGGYLPALAVFSPDAGR
ncbi:MAG: hypothetical protein JWN84_3684 [Nocardioides sp.]|nr:hypothetical protein [Nocardioides sp.]